MKKALSLILSLAMVFALCACGTTQDQDTTTPPPASDGETTYDTANLTYSINGTSTSIEAQVANLFKERIEEATNGSITVTIYTDAQLAGGDLSASVEAAQSGVMDIYCADTSVIAALDPTIGVSAIPFAYSGYDEVEAAYDTTGGEYISNALKDYNLTYATYAHNGLQCLTCSKIQLDTPENFKNIKIRISGTQLNIDMYTALGADPSALNWSETYTALQNGTYDAQSNSPATIKSGNIQEVQNYLTVSRHTYGAFLISFYTPTFESFNEATQELLMTTLQSAAKEVNEKTASEEETILQEFEDAGMEVSYLSDEQTAAFKEALADVIDKYKAEYGEAACEAFNIT